MTLRIYTAIVDRFSEKQAVIKLEDGSEVLWPIKNLPDQVTVGSQLKLTLSDNKDNGEEKEQLAKKMLNEILNVKKDQPV